MQTQQAPESLIALKSQLLINSRALNLILYLLITLLKIPQSFTVTLLGTPNIGLNHLCIWISVFIALRI